MTKDVDPYSIMGGIPARIIKKRFNDDIIRELLKIKWWDWEIKKLKKLQLIMNLIIFTYL